MQEGYTHSVHMDGRRHHANTRRCHKTRLAMWQGFDHGFHSVLMLVGGTAPLLSVLTCSLPLDHCAEELVDEVIVPLPADALVPESDVHGIHQ